MISIYDLYDLHSILVGIRFAPQSRINKAVVSKAIEVLENRHKNNDFNQFRKAIHSIALLDDNKLYDWAEVENRYCYMPLPFLKDEKIYNILIKSLECLSNELDQKKDEKIYDLADCLHNLPIVLTENHYTIPKSFWKNEIASYRLKWDQSFLLDEQKKLKK